MSRISFGTSGWRGIFCEDFTFENVKVVTQAIADHLRSRGQESKGLIVGYDSRFMGERFARETARVLAGAGIKSYVCDRDTPTPVIAFEILRRKTAGGINFTASHNPPEYNGLKFSPDWGGPALPETTGDIEERANAMLGELCYKEMTLDNAFRAGLVEEIDPRPGYFEAIRKIIDFSIIARSGMTIGVDPLYGTGRGYLDTLLMEAGVKVITLNDHRDPYFGGLPPNRRRAISGISSLWSRAIPTSGWGWPPTATPTATASSTATGLSSNRTTSWPCCSTIWCGSRGRRGPLPGRSPPLISSMPWPPIMALRCSKPRSDSSSSANTSAMTGFSSGEKRARD